MSVNAPPSVAPQYPPRMKRTQSKESLSEPPSKVPTIVSPSTPISGDVPAVAGSSASLEAAPAAVGASAP